MIQKQTFDFLTELADNNNREWFMDNKARHDAARENVIDFAGKLIKELHKIDPAVPAEMDPKKCVLRIYRDIRFSKNKTPYKNNFGISLPTTGVKAGGAEYYFQVQPGKSFIAGGYWMPEAAHLKAIRQEIDYNGRDLQAIIDDAEFVKLFGSFRDQDKLKTLPRDYSADNENIELLKLKSFIAWHELKDKDLMKTDLVDKIAAICSKIYPLNVFLRNAIV
jgi:uncharacterized protein (TIGR02453 family)